MESMQLFLLIICKFVGGDEKHEMRHDPAFGVKKNVNLHCSSQRKTESLEERMGDSKMCNDTW